MSKSDTSGPAFPQSHAVTIEDPEGGHGHYDAVIDVSGGLSIRDYFAGQALAASGFREGTDSSYYDQVVAPSCYRMADAMLRAREQDGGDE